jgi:hypothetical protein
VLDRQVDSLPEGTAAHLTDGPAQATYELLRSRLLDFMAAIGDFPDPEQAVMAVVMPYANLLEALGLPSKQAAPRIADLARQLAELLDSMPSLAWIEASAGEIVNLQVTYSTRDPKHNPAYDGSTPSARSAPEDSYASLRADIYRDLGLAPIKHEFDAPSPRHVNSYSFMIEPPEKTSLMYLDWETGNSLERDETATCSLDSAYPRGDHHEGIASPSSGVRVRAFLRVSPHQRVQILAAAALNLVAVWLLRDGHAPGHFGDPIQSFVLVAPSALIAYLVSQQRHYYAYPMRRQRGILWGYLAISVLFFIVGALTKQDGSIGYEELNPVVTFVAWVLFVSSVAVFFWYLPLGFGFNWIVAYFTKRRWETSERHTQKWEAYVVVYQRYGRAVFYLVAVAALVAIGFLASAWDGSSSGRRTRPKSHSVLVNGSASRALLGIGRDQ